MLQHYSIQTFMDALYEHRGVVIITVISLCVLSASTIYIVWSTSIHKQLQFLQNSAFFTNWYEPFAAKSRTSGSPQKDPFRMIRCRMDNNDLSRPSIPNVHMLTLNPDFVIYCNNLNNEMAHSKNSTSLSSSPPPQQQHSSQPWNVMSLGEYISSLRPFFTAPSGIDGRQHPDQESSSESSSMIPNWVEGEIQAALAVALFTTVGPQFGTAILPTLGLNLMQKTVRKIASVLSSYMPNFENEDHKEKGKSEKGDDGILFDDVDDIYSDLGSVPLSISTMSTGAEINYQRSQRKQKMNNQKGSSMKDTLSPLDLLRIGEVGYPLSFARREDCNAGQVDAVETVDDLPNPFVVSEHWYSTIEQMEERMKCNDDTYDPFSFRMQPPPKVVDERFFPDLYIGWGDHVSCSHNQRQILYNRLMSTLLNRLAYNLHINVTTSRQDNPPVSPLPKHFIVQISTTNASEITTPCDFIQALIDSGHRVVTCIQTQPTTFGMSLCVKEVVSDDHHHQWKNIPLGYFLQTGLSDIKGNEAYVCLPHSGLSLEISKGAVIHDANISIQHYMAIEGLCGWHSNHSANVPWIRPLTCQDTTRHNNEVLESVRVAALQAIIINTVGTKYDLPFGGYGLTGVCNDSAAQIECAISKDGKTTHIFPLSFHGKFAMHTLRVANEMRQTLSSQDQQMLLGSADEIKSIDRLIHAIMSLPSDTNTAPILDMIDQCERYIHCCGPSAVSFNDRQNTTNASTVTTSDNAPPPAFQLLVESRSIVESIRKEIVNISK